MFQSREGKRPHYNSLCVFRCVRALLCVWWERGSGRVYRVDCGFKKKHNNGSVVVLHHFTCCVQGPPPKSSCDRICCATTRFYFLFVISAQLLSPCRSSSAGLGSACRSSCWSCSCAGPRAWPPPPTWGAWTRRPRTSNISGACGSGQAAAAAGTATGWWRCPYLQEDRSVWASGQHQSSHWLFLR